MDIWSKQKRSAVMSKIRATNTRCEVNFRRALHALGFRYRINFRNLPGVPDVVLPKYKTVIFVHGCFWHQHNQCVDGRRPKSKTEYWDKKLSKNLERDENNRIALEKAGWLVLTVWECEIEKDLPAVVQHTIKHLEERLKGIRGLP